MYDSGVLKGPIKVYALSFVVIMSYIFSARGVLL